ncbi:hypothetical protein ACJJTC_005066 [Scirpophaga incertulas]
MSDLEEYISASDNSSFFSCDDSSDDASDLNNCLSREFGSCCDTFNVCHINAQSIPQHYTDILDSFSSDNVHALLVSESWLKPRHSMVYTLSLAHSCVACHGVVAFPPPRVPLSEMTQWNYGITSRHRPNIVCENL